MDSEKIKEIWKENAVKQIENYTDYEITSIVLKTARKAINQSFPSIIFWSVLILFDLLCVWIMMIYMPPQLQMYGYILMTIIFVTLLGAVCISEWERRKTQHYSFDMSLKEWVELRMRDFDKSIERIKRNWFWRFGFGFIALLIFSLAYILTVGFSLKILLIQLITGVPALIIVGTIAGKILMKRMVETRKQLQELYHQLQNSEELND